MSPKWLIAGMSFLGAWKAYFYSPGGWVWWLWLGLAALTVSLVILMRTRLGERRPLRKCFILSLWAHAIFAGFAATIEIAGPPLFRSEESESIQLTLVDSLVPNDSRNNPWQGEEFGDLSSPLDVLSSSEGLGLKALVKEVDAGRPAISPSFLRLAQRTSPFKPVSESPHRLLPSEVFLPVEPTSAPFEEISEEAPEFWPVATEGVPLPPEKEPTDQDTETIPETPTHSEPEKLPFPPLPGLDLSSQSAPLSNPLRLQIRYPGSRGLNGREEIGIPEAQLGEVLSSELVEIPVANPTEGPELVAPEAAEANPAATTVRIPPVPDLTEVQRDPVEPTTKAASADRPPPLKLHLPKLQDLGEVLGAEGDRKRTVGLLVPDKIPTGEGGLSGSEALAPQVVWRETTRADTWEVPAIYRLRLAPNRQMVGQMHGATPATDAAVERGLAWLARNQDPDGRWNPRRHQAGIERFVAGRDRQGAGNDADTAMTGLALLAFLGAGYSHHHGPYQDQVRRGLEFLVRSQDEHGSLAGGAGYYSAMYCHAIALLALAEAYALTGAGELREPIARGVRFTIRAQDPQGGGWRYRPGDPGDTSLLGWQLLALKSAEYTGLQIPSEVFRRAEAFLESVSSGRAGGLAAYRAVERATPAMTAEALVCRFFLGAAPEDAPVQEAVEYLLRALPGKDPPNFYYWYYGTIAMFQVGGEAWQRWNQALRQTLVTMQRRDQPWEGSWDPVCVWGGYGGRVYTTALAILCLETYYRYLPLLQSTGPNSYRTAGSPVQEGVRHPK